MASTPQPERLTSATFRARREYLGLPASWLAKHLDVQERTVRKWDAGEAPIPYRVTGEFERLAALTAEFVDDTARQLSADPIGTWPFEIPRTVSDRDAMTPANDWPLDWWRNVGARLLDRVPGLWLDWTDF